LDRNTNKEASKQLNSKHDFAGKKSGRSIFKFWFWRLDFLFLFYQEKRIINSLELFVSFWFKPKRNIMCAGGERCGKVGFQSMSSSILNKHKSIINQTKNKHTWQTQTNAP
jgi:hypothetical protein